MLGQNQSRPREQPHHPSPADLDLNEMDGVSVHNGNFFGFSCPLSAANVVFLPVPWDVTTSYGEGAADGPQAILDASYQLDWYDFDVPAAWGIGHATLPIDVALQQKNQRLRAIAKSIIEHLETGGQLQDKAIQAPLAQVNQASVELNHWVHDRTRALLAQDKLIGLVGGDHSVPLGYMQALLEKHGEYGILQIDAHADLRPSYEGFHYSHASIMHHALQLKGISHLVQVGIRDVCEGEVKQMSQDPRITLFDDWRLKENAYTGMPWADQCEKIVSSLPQKVYVSFDIDGLNPAFCPNTGTPVPGGLDFNQVIYLLKTLVKRGKTMIGFDLCEVSPGASGEWDGNVGARILYKLSNLMYLSQS